MDQVVISKIQSSDEKMNIVREVLLDLPEYFGLEESTQEYISKSSGYALWAAYDGDKLIGFKSLKETSPYTAEIYCMGMKRDYHRYGIGTKLYRAFNEYSRTRYEYEQVKTVAYGTYDIYDNTVNFYKSLGFRQLEVFHDLWEDNNPCLIMVKSTQI